MKICQKEPKNLEILNGWNRAMGQRARVLGSQLGPTSQKKNRWRPRVQPAIPMRKVT